MVFSNDKEGGAPQIFFNLGPQLPCYATVEEPYEDDGLIGNDGIGGKESAEFRWQIQVA